jgi:hypothetical protein
MVDYREIVNDHGIRAVMLVIGVLENVCICKVVELPGNVLDLGLLFFIPMGGDNKVFFHFNFPFWLLACPCGVFS